MLACIRTLNAHTEHIVYAFSRGRGRHAEIITPHEFLRNPNRFDGAAVFGFLRGSDKVLKFCIKEGIDYYFIDHAYLCRTDHKNPGGARGIPNGTRPMHRRNTRYNASELSDPIMRYSHHFYRITKNGYQNTNYENDRPNDRVDKYFSIVKIMPWRPDARKVILVCPPDQFVIDFFGLGSWEKDKLLELDKRCGNGWTVRVRKRTTNIPFHADLRDVYLLVTHFSNAAIEAVIAGVPAIVDSGSVFYPFSKDNLVSPWMGDRNDLLRHLSYSQFTIGEMNDGTAWKILNE